jgi:hypothetical protein
MIFTIAVAIVLENIEESEGTGTLSVVRPSVGKRKFLPQFCGREKRKGNKRIILQMMWEPGNFSRKIGTRKRRNFHQQFFTGTKERIWLLLVNRFFVTVLRIYIQN